MNVIDRIGLRLLAGCMSARTDGDTAHARIARTNQQGDSKVRQAAFMANVISRGFASDGGPGSGNWGHKGRPGKRGGSGKGGGVQNRLGLNPKTGYHSFAKVRKQLHSFSSYSAVRQALKEMPDGDTFKLVDADGKEYTFQKYQKPNGEYAYKNEYQQVYSEAKLVDTLVNYGAKANIPLPESDREKFQNFRKSERKVVEGSNIYDSYDGPDTIRDVMKAQGFEGPPKLVGKAEFDKAVAASNFVAQRGYKASSQEVLDAYTDQLYNGYWYVDCTSGGSVYGLGMYCAADYDGQLSERTMFTAYNYSYTEDNAVGKVVTFTLDPSAKIIDYDAINDLYNGNVPNGASYKYRQQRQEAHIQELSKKYGDKSEDVANVIRYAMYGKSSGISWEQSKALEEKLGDSIIRDAMKEWASASDVIRDEVKEYEAKAAKYVQEHFSGASEKYGDVSSFAVSLGYDAINAGGRDRPGAVTVILNRTKCIFLNDEGGEGNG